MGQLVEFIIANVLTTSIIIAAISFFLKEKLKAYIQSSTKINYDKVLEEFKYSQIQRQKAILVAELIAEWISHPEDRKRLNQLTLEAFIWLPKDTANRLSDLLSHKPGSGSVRDVIAEVRAIILGKQESIDANDIILFLPIDKKKEE
jgi:hypothetical protein